MEMFTASETIVHQEVINYVFKFGFYMLICLFLSVFICWFVCFYLFLSVDLSVFICWFVCFYLLICLFLSVDLSVFICWVVCLIWCIFHLSLESCHKNCKPGWFSRLRCWQWNNGKGENMRAFFKHSHTVFIQASGYENPTYKYFEASVA